MGVASMGLSSSLLSWDWINGCLSNGYGLEEAKDVSMTAISLDEKDNSMSLRSLSFKQSDQSKNMVSNASKSLVLEKALSFKFWELEVPKFDATFSFEKKQVVNDSTSEPMESLVVPHPKLPQCLPEFSSPRPKCELDAAATKLQKVYKSYRTRRNLADCAVVVEELWWKALDSASLEHSSVSFFKVEKQETAVSRWARARTRAAKVGKGLSKDEKAQKLALQHWLEAIDPRHRYGHNLNLYYDVWFQSESTQPFFYWLDAGDGHEINLEKCPRNRLQNQCVTYLGPKEREAYEAIVKNGKLVYKQSEMPISTVEGSKWIFVLSTSRVLYIGQKKKGTFQHSSFLAGGATTAAGRLVATEGILKAIWPYSGHYLPTEENFKEFITFLQENNVDLSNVKRYSIDDDECPSFKKRTGKLEDAANKPAISELGSSVQAAEFTQASEDSYKADTTPEDGLNQAMASELGEFLSCKWTTANGARIGCVRDYPVDLQLRALEQVNLSPRVTPPTSGGRVPIPSPRPSPKLRLSPRLQYMGILSPRVSLTLPEHRRLSDDVSSTNQ